MAARWLSAPQINALRSSDPSNPSRISVAILIQPGTEVKLQQIPLVDSIVLEHCAASLIHVGHPSLRYTVL